MAQLISGNTIKLSNGQTVQGQNGGWYDGQQLFNGQLGAAGQDLMNGGGTVSADVIAQTNPNNVAYVNQQRASQGLAPVPSTAGSSSTLSPASNTATTTPSTSSSLNLPDLYNQMSSSAGIPALQKKANSIQAQIDAITSQQASATAENNENPFLSEANRVGKEENINTNSQNQIDALTGNLNEINNQISTATNNINTQLGLQVQQEQINETQQQNALSQLNTLMSNGVLGNLSASDMSSISAQTGLPTDVIQEMVTKSNQADISPQLIQTANGVTLIDANTGNIIKSVDIPGMTSTTSATSIKAAYTQQVEQAAGEQVAQGATLQWLYENFGPGTEYNLSAQDLLNIYNKNSTYGAAQETVSDIENGNFATNPGGIQ